MANKPHVNKPCPCGSGIKYKKCCGNPKIDFGTPQPKQSTGPDFRRIHERKKAEELTRTEQQGLGRPIVAGNFKEHLVVGVKNRVYFVPKGRTFPDFLLSFLPSVIGKEWFERELKASAPKHPIPDWHQSYCTSQKKHFDPNQELSSMPENGIACCYLGLAYGLYLLQHNVELQTLFVNRLKDRNNFQGTYYELIVAACLIRAGFDLGLEDETDDSQKHCEFYAVSKKTGKKYWVEAKARAVSGVLCKTDSNGTKSKDATSSLSDQISAAMKKPASGPRLIFVDVNSPEDSSASLPSWIPKAERKLVDKERNLKPGESAYIFVTNMNFHLHLEGENRPHGVLGYGLGITDFGKTGYFTLREMYRQKEAHIDAHDIMVAFKKYPSIPSTVDGSLPSDSLQKNPQSVKIGETYDFEGIGLATVTTATVDETSNTAVFGTSNGRLISKKMSPVEIADYKKHRDTYFGVVSPQTVKAETPFEFFEWMVEIHLQYSEESILGKLQTFSDAEEIKNLPHKERVLVYCERMTASMLPTQKPTR